MSRTSEMMYVQSGKWAEKRNLIHEFIPFKYREKNPVEIIRKVNNEIENSHEYRKIIRMGHIDELDAHNKQVHSVMPLYMEFLGAWQAPKHSSRGSRKWVNPNYGHIEHTPDVDEDIFSFARRVALLGTWSIRDVANACGLESHSSVAHYFTDKTFGEFRERGIERLANTLKLWNEWGYSHREISEAAPLVRQTVTKYINKKSTIGSVPPDPSAEVELVRFS